MPSEPRFDLTSFSLVEMTQCGAHLRALGGGARTQEEVAGRVVRLLYDGLVDAETDERQCALVRVFKTLRHGDLPDDLRAFAARTASGPIDDDTRCMTLIGSAGLRPEWNARQTSVNHQAIPLVDPEALARLPMIAHMLEQFGVQVSSFGNPSLQDSNLHGFEVFHVAEAQGSSHVPAQDDFVVPFDIRSVVGYGGALPGGEIFAVILFCRVPVSKATADLFPPLALNTLSAFLHVHPAATFAGQERDRASDRRTSASRTYEALLAVQDRILIDQWNRLASAEADRDRFFSLSIDMLCVADLDGYFKRVNPAFSRTLGYTAEELTSKPFPDLVHPEDRKRTEEIMQRLAHGGDVEQFYNRYRCKDGSYRWLSWSCPAPRGGGELYAVARDITHNVEQEQHLQEAREEAEAANRAKDAFLANMSHEIRTPLNSILGFAQLVLETKIEPFQRHWLDNVVRSGKSLVRIINDILDFSKMRAGKFRLEAGWFDLRDTVERAVEALAPQAHSGGLELTSRIDADVPDMLHGDGLRVGQVLTNLLANGIKFTRNGEVGIHVRADAIDDERALLHVTVHDTGIGIPAEQHETIFAPFSQADMSSSRRFAGTGLGLSICHSLVTQMGGEIRVESEAGKGSTFHVSIPFAHCAGQPGLEPMEALAGMRVSVAEDNATTRTFLVDQLRAWGMEPTAHATAPGALVQVREEASDEDPVPLLIVDSELPPADGFALVETALAASPTTRAVLTLTTRDLPASTARAESIGAAWVVKPIQPAKLLDAITRVTAASLTAVTPRPARQRADRSAHHLRILLAEDSETNQALFLSLLRRRGHYVVVARDGEQALARARAETFDLILMDVQMPGLDGIDATRALRADEANGATVPPIVALTARATRADRRACLAAGMVDCIIKPIQIRTFYETIDRVVGAPPLRDGVDWSAALETVSGEDALLQKLVTSSREELPRLVNGIRKALDAGDLRTVGRHAHTLHSVVGHLGATSAEGEARQLQTAARGESLTDAAASFTRLRRRVEEVLDSLEEGRDAQG